MLTITEVGGQFGATREAFAVHVIIVDDKWRRG